MLVGVFILYQNGNITTDLLLKHSLLRGILQRFFIAKVMQIRQTKLSCQRAGDNKNGTCSVHLCADFVPLYFN